MRNAIAAVAFVICAGACVAVDQPADGTFEAFWTAFSEAVEQNSEADVRELTRFPFMYESRDRTGQEFGEVYAALFGPEVRACIANATPTLEDDSYMVFCGPIIYVFAQHEGVWRFTEFAADPEAVLETGA